ncbi:MAG: hypothetical protein JXA20_01985 [Spirochaetes bacterium]|nr:hypothetical protein [Spirochaetota bacterium]
MKKNISLLLVAIFAFSVALGLIGCKKEEAAAPEEPAATEQPAPEAPAEPAK